MWRDIWQQYWKRIMGAGIGLFFGFIYLFFGFWDMLFVGVLVAAGYWYGKQKEYVSGPLVPWDRVREAVGKLFKPYR